MTVRCACANPDCETAQHGRPRYLGTATIPPGGALELPRCPACRWATTVSVDRAGAVAFSCVRTSGGQGVELRQVNARAPARSPVVQSRHKR